MSVAGLSAARDYVVHVSWADLAVLGLGIQFKGFRDGTRTQVPRVVHGRKDDDVFANVTGES